MAILAVTLTISNPERNLFRGELSIKKQSVTEVSMAGSVASNNISPDITSQNSKNESADFSTPAIASTGIIKKESSAESQINTNQQEETLFVANQSQESIIDGIEKGTLTETTTVENFYKNEVFTAHSGLSNQQEVNESTVNIIAINTGGVTERNNAIAEKSFVNASLAYSPADAAINLPKLSKWSIQVYATPSISYRYLMEDKKYVDDPASINGPLAPYLTHSVNEFVRHTPKLGLEAGAAVLYALSENLRLKTGLQLNYRHYGINAYATSTMEPAILALNRGNGVDSLVRYTNISSQNGYRELELSSNSMQLAIPIGFDLKMAQLNKIGFFLAATGQLTYQLGNNSYVLSADYKNYIKQPGLDRKFNINTAIEAFINFEAGGVTWQAGPQIRYQMLPGTTSAYPIREHLIDYGMKVGVVKTLR
jgi:hypothetical protein